MSYYTTPRRRHSSLFQRMENEIKKISKKLSAAKQSYRGSSSTKIKNSHLVSYNSVQDRNPRTVRRYPQPTETTQPLKANTLNLKRKINSGLASRGESVQFQEGFFDRTYNNNANRIIMRLQDENMKLSHRLGKVEQICQDQSYKLGYMKAQLKQTSRQLQIQKQKQFKQTCYLNTLVDYYKKKSKKYKQILKQNNGDVSIRISSDVNK